MDGIRFKVPGNHHLCTFDQLRKIPNVSRFKSIKVIDLNSQRNWCATYRTIVRKFG